jgi:hypothetical protein
MDGIYKYVVMHASSEKPKTQRIAVVTGISLENNTDQQSGITAKTSQTNSHSIGSSQGYSLGGAITAENGVLIELAAKYSSETGYNFTVSQEVGVAIKYTLPKTAPAGIYSIYLTTKISKCIFDYYDAIYETKVVPKQDGKKASTETINIVIGYEKTPNPLISGELSYYSKSKEYYELVKLH